MEKFHPIDFVYVVNVDISEVDQFGIIDLRAAFVNHVVPENVALSDESFNNVEDAQTLIGRPTDVFDAIRKAEYVSKRAASAAATTEGAAATPSGTE